MNILPTDALIIVDPQNDFVPGGALAVTGGDEIMAGIVTLARNFHAAGAVIVMTQDWHPADHTSFASNHISGAMVGPEPFSTIEMPYGSQVLWPDHCIQRSEGGDFVDAIVEAEDYANLIIRKGMNPKIDSYSAFFENDKETSTGLAGYLRNRGITRVILVGLAYDFCVGYSAIDAKKEGFDAMVVKSLTRAIAMPIPVSLTDGHECTTVDLIESEFDVVGVTVVEELI